MHSVPLSLSPNAATRRSGRALDHACRTVRGWFHRELRGTFEQLRARRGKSGR
jgi:hypothetical protein